MTEHHRVPVARPEVVRAWVDGWVRSRGTDGAVEVPGGFRIAVGRTDQVARYVLPAADPTVLRRLSVALITPGLWLKVCAPRSAVEPALPASWEFQAPEYLMTAPLGRTTRDGARTTGVPDGLRDGLVPGAAPAPPPDPAVLPGGYVVETVAQGGIVDARAFAATGEVAAGGRVALAGATAVFDQVTTDPAHRRQGLGRVVMTALAARAAQQGATQGVLVARDDGLSLYRAMGWELHSPVTTAVLRRRGTR
ncbi:GNAT family N-acetyltransferase [Streptomyces sp. Ru73]|uniref:GNAT family N-acetyltransferase n=1 Tax=Streptomyces sp. Ru73 TaxID=2080748 RepID=UPI000CDCE2BF|nr:GNAT family N-acetyltransferase [Streptomyces sp. Ru73]POX40301.1 GNAT family N-acetyltransferase [Streptomyces sp. Ru73]